MIFTFKAWEDFCRLLKEENIQSVTAEEVLTGAFKAPYLVLKHDVETAPLSALKMAEIEAAFGHKASYYVQAYLMQDEKNVPIFKKMQALGHEISYHYDCLDSAGGDLDKAIEEFTANKDLFFKNGFRFKTVCQHGNPVVERVGYTSNRDLFRSDKVQKLYGDMADIMVDFKEKSKTDYKYYSDAGRKFNLIYDPVNNDIINSDDKNIPYKNLKEVKNAIGENNAIISSHPHRYTKSAAKYVIKTAIFKIVRILAKAFAKIPVFKKIMSKYYYLAKKI